MSIFAFKTKWTVFVEQQSREKISRKANVKFGIYCDWFSTNKCSTSNFEGKFLLRITVFNLDFQRLQAIVTTNSMIFTSATTYGSISSWLLSFGFMLKGSFYLQLINQCVFMQMYKAESGGFHIIFFNFPTLGLSKIEKLKSKFLHANAIGHDLFGFIFN